MNDSMMDVIEALNKANKRLVEALRDAHHDLEDMKGHIASITDPDPKACSCSQEVVRSVIARDTTPIAGMTSDGVFNDMRSLVNGSPDNTAALADRKITLGRLVDEAEKRYNGAVEKMQAAMGKAEEAEDLATYHKGQTAQYKANWEALSQACRAFSDNFNRENMNGDVRDSLDDMLSKCEVAVHNT